ncbi:hypothetical protein TFLX_02516 [Thermoflexales bacterium]|nr:hypothetical protein TFLX_02516 [Thermoflexales bacterium]
MKHIIAQLMIVLVLTLSVAACGNAPTSSSPAQLTTKPNNNSQPVSAEATTAGIDLSQVDVCELLPVAEVEAVIGAVRQGSTKPTRSLDRERGCHYVDAKHVRFYEVELYPLDQWNLAKRTLKDAQPVADVGDGAYLGTYSDCKWLKVLVKDRVVIGVRVGDEKQATALALYEVMLKHLP